MTTENPQAPESSTDPENPPAAAKPGGRFRMSAKKWLVLGLAVVLLAGVGVGTWFLLKPKTATSASSTRTVQVSKGTQTMSVAFDGTLSPRKQSNVNFSVSGTVTSVNAKAGQTVKKGQKLAVVDDADLQDAVDLAQANLTTAKANLSDVYDNDGSSAAITSAKAQVSSAKAALAQANTNLDDAVLRSPISGTVASVSIEDGDTVTGSGSSGSGSNSSTTSTTSTASTAQFVVISTSTWKLEGSVGSADLATLKAGQAVAITTDATTDKLTGTVASVGIVATSTSDGAATFPIVINLAGEHKDLYSGTTASAVITTGSYPDVLTVPTAAIRTENSTTVVSKVTGTTVTTTEVTIGTVFGTYTEIKSGLAEGDSVQITFTRPTSSSTGSASSQGGGFGGGFGGGITDGGPPAGAPAGGTGR
ncbi:MAG TPA: biotin/lipoyl-binding protein [Propionicimonas sp.]|uniref:efflux RND transporter periplasmic adaptor subunit n=1 Tax=Propionicimonas sp. TaxID=1955623 RepID=UPI002F42A661